MKLGAWWLGAALALIGSTITPAMADEWNKETRLEINEPLEIPGKVLTPGKYVFKLADSPSNRNIVEVFSEDANGKQTLVATILAASAYSMNTPDKTIIRLEERPSGSPPAIHEWFYPGDNFGWEFVYRKSEPEQVAAIQLPAEEPAPAPALPDPLAVETVASDPVEPEVVEETVIAEEEALIPVPDAAAEVILLPETAGHSATELGAGVAMLGLGLMTVFVARRRAER